MIVGFENDSTSSNAAAYCLCTCVSSPTAAIHACVNIRMLQDVALTHDDSLANLTEDIQRQAGEFNNVGPNGTSIMIGRQKLLYTNCHGWDRM